MADADAGTRVPRASDRRVTLDRLAGPIRRWLYAGGTRHDRLRDPDAVIAVLDLRPGMVVGDLGVIPR